MVRIFRTPARSPVLMEIVLMTWRLNPPDDAVSRTSGPGERATLAAVRLAAVPVLLVAVVLAGAIYGLGGMAGVVASAARRARRGFGAGQGRGKAATSSR